MSDVCGCQADIDLAAIDQVLEDYKSTEGALIPVLQAAQAIYGYLPARALEKIAEVMGLPISQIFGVVTFYSQFKMKPRGKHIIRLCRGTACHVRGAGAILNTLEEHLNVHDGDTTKDGQFTLETVACVGACSLGPVVLIDDNAHGRLKSDQLAEVLAPYMAVQDESKAVH
jgi:NADH:ubiquinone oxidoreductase 24 kD subunit